MASPDAKLAVDTSVALPPSVLRASQAADAIHAQAYGPGTGAQETPAPQSNHPRAADAPADPPAQPAAVVDPPAQPDPVVQNPPAQPDPAQQQQQPALPSSTPEQRAGAEPGSWEGRYYSMEGRFRQAMEQVGSLQGQLGEMGDELGRLHGTINQMNRGERMPAPQQQQRQRPAASVTDQDRETYGPELLEVMQRVARAAVQPDLEQVQNQTRQVSQRVAVTGQQSLAQKLDDAVPEWRQINQSPRFKNWCRLPDVYSNAVRGRLLNAAYQAADAPRVVAFFKGFLSEEQATGQMPPAPAAQAVASAPAQAAPRQAAVALESLTAPGRPKPAGGDSPAAAADKPVFTRAQIATFYADVRRGAYTGRDQDKANLEASIFAAQKDGRVR